MRLLHLGAALVLVLLLVPVSLGLGQERGITASEIIIGSTVPLSGPAGYWGIGVGKGMEAYLSTINEQGGINGRKFRVVLLDDAYLPPRASLNARELVERHGVFAIVGMIGTANTFAARDYLLESKVLWITPTTSDIFAGLRPERKRYLFTTYVSYINEARIMTQYAAEKLGTKSIAVFYQNDLYGQQLLLGVKRSVAGLKGVKFAGQASYEITEADVSAQAVKLRSSGADTVYVAATPTHGALIVREMGKLGYRPRLVTSATLADPIMFRLAAEAWNDIHATFFFIPPGMGDARVDQMLATLVRVEPALRTTPYNAAAGVAFVEPLVEAIRRAGRDLTRDKVVAELERLRDWDGDVVRGVTFGPERRQGLNRVFIGKAEGGKHVRVTDWITYQPSY